MSVNRKKGPLDMSDVDKIFTDNLVPLRSLVNDLTHDSYRRSIFLEHMKKLKENRQQ